MEEIYQNELEKCKIYELLKSKAQKETDLTESSVVKLVNEVVEYACNKSKVIIKYLPEYTLHDETHLFRVYQLMDRIIPDETLQKLSVPELMMLSLVAFLHDIGMAPLESDIRAWKKGWAGEKPTSTEQNEHDKFKRFRDTFPSKISEIKQLREKELYSKAELIESYIISEYIRETHEQRAREFIAFDWAEKIRYKDTDLTNELAQLCYSHGCDALSLLDFEVNVLCDENSFVCLPFIGVIIRLADLMDFDAKRTPRVLFSHLAVRNPVSLSEWQKHRNIQSWRIKNDYITFHAKCKHPAIEKSIKDFCDYIDNELKNCSNVLSRLEDSSRSEEMQFIRFQLPAKVDRSRIVPEKNILTNEPLYIYKDTSFELSKNQVIDLLMGTKLYDDTKAAMRELIQNSIDACLVAEALCNELGFEYSPKIDVRYYTEDGQSCLEVEDNGIGMNQRIIDNYYSKVGSSYYKSRDFYDLKAKTNIKHVPISRFGIGILSCFMVSDTIEVETRKLLDDGELDSPFLILIEGYDSIFTLKKGTRKKHGTSTRLLLRKKENPWEEMSKTRFMEYVKQSIPNPPLEIKVHTDKEDKEENILILNKDSFSQMSAEELKNYQWKSSEYINEVKISLDSEEKGLKGEAIIGILEDKGLPTTLIDGMYRTVTIENEEYNLENKIELKENKIEKIGSIIEVDIDSGIDTRNSSDEIIRSQSRISIHGISFPAGIFPDNYFNRRKAVLKWPLPMLIVVDVTGNNDLDLNSARTEIVFNKKWNDFEESLANLIFQRLKDKLDESYWNHLVETVVGASSSDNFSEGLKKHFEGIN
ncbi:MAG: HD domain-containing protein [Bacteroidota bacterium]